jgi:ATP-dependent RNA helicase RhlE
MPFKALGLDPSLVQATREMRYAEPTPIQAEAIPAILAGRDLIATAQTGTGKTAAFLLPILHQLLGLPRGTTQALIITPTRELAQQIDDVCLGLAYHTPVRIGILVGGTAMGPQEKALRAGVELLVATPGRLLDHMRQNQVRFDRLHTLVLDEADRMLDMGFLPDLKRIIARLPARKQTLLFSATIPPVIVNLAKEILRNPLTIHIGQRSAPAVGITQAAYPVAEHLKTALLRHLLRHMDMPSVLVFTRTKQAARRLARTVAADGFAVTELHSNLTQPQRNRAMEGFRRGDFQGTRPANHAELSSARRPR